MSYLHKARKEHNLRVVSHLFVCLLAIAGIWFANWMKWISTDWPGFLLMFGTFEALILLAIVLGWLVVEKPLAELRDKTERDFDVLIQKIKEILQDIREEENRTRASLIQQAVSLKDDQANN